MNATYPDVPDAPGVPPVPRNATSFIAPEPDLITEDDISIAAAQAAQPKWGIFNSAGDKSALDADSTLEVEFVSTNRLMDFPVGQQSFATYNKVITPYSFRIVLAKAGDNDSIEAFLKSVDAMVNDNKTYSCVTPSATYANANAVHYDYRRTAENGSHMVIVHIYFEEVRKVASVALSKPKLDTKDNGPISATPVQSKPAPGVTSVAVNPGATSIPITSGSSLSLPKVPVETPATSALGPKFSSVWSDANGKPLNSDQLNAGTGLPLPRPNDSAAFFKIDGDKPANLKSFNPNTGVSGSVKPTEAPYPIMVL